MVQQIILGRLDYVLKSEMALNFTKYWLVSPNIMHTWNYVSLGNKPRSTMYDFHNSTDTLKF